MTSDGRPTPGIGAGRRQTLYARAMTSTRACVRRGMRIASLAAILALGGCGGGGSSPPPPAPPPPNRAPVADAGSDLTQSIEPSPVTLDGSNSSDPDDDDLTFSWELQEQPDTADTQLENASGAQTSFVARVPGEYVFGLEVSDPDGLSSSDTVTVTLTNEPPVAEISAVERSALVGGSVTLDASGSSDPDGHELRFAWRTVESPAESAVRPSHEGPLHTIRFDRRGRYVFELELNDGYASTTMTLDAFDITVYTVHPLNDRIIDAEFDASDERIIAVAENKLIAIGPDGGQTDVPLPARAKAVSISPDGATAAVGHNGFVTHVDLNALNVLATHAVPDSLGDIVIDAQGHAHGFPDVGQWTRVYSVDLQSGNFTRSSGGFVRHRVRARLHPSGTRIYSADTDLSPSDLQRYSIVNGALRPDYDSPYHGDYFFCGNVWFDPRGRLILSPCGVVVRATDDRSTDMHFAMQLDGLGDNIRHASSSAFEDLWYLVLQGGEGSSGRVHTFDLEYGQAVESFDLPLADSEEERRWLADFVFASADSGAHYVIAAAGTGADGPQRQALLVRPAPEGEVLSGHR